MTVSQMTRSPTGTVLERARDVEGPEADANLLELVLLRCLVFASFCGLPIELFRRELVLGISRLFVALILMYFMRTFRLNRD